MALKAKRGVDEILNETIPKNSKELYVKRWLDFMDFMGAPSRRPNEDDYLQYFDFLHNEKKASSIWSIYSSLNSIHQREFGEKLQVYPRVTQLLKTYNSTYKRKVASVFEGHHIDTFFQMELITAYWVVRKAVVAVAICGGLRCAEVRDIEFSDVIQKENEYEILVVRKKQRGEVKKSKFIVPQPFYLHLATYLSAVRGALGDDVSGPLIKGAPKLTFVNQAMGKNYLSNIGKDVALVLNLEEPERYTGHCFRRTAATMAADGGATTQQLQKAFGWTSTHTAQRYVDESSAGARSMATIISNTVQKNTTISSSSSGRDGGEQGTSGTKIYHIHASGENNVYHFN